jgi:hypothetical protein
LGSPVRNVSIVGVGTSGSNALKETAGAIAPGFSIADSFTFNLDPRATNANNQVAALSAINV